MRPLILIATLFVSLIVQPASADQAEGERLACQVLAERADWIDQMRRTEDRWGLSIEAQLALFSEEWQLEADNLPHRWRPEWTVFDRGEPGILPGYFDATWSRYKHETGNQNARVNRFTDISDFMGWYFSSVSQFTRLAPGDAAGFYVIWRRGPDYFGSGAWRSDTGMVYRAQTFAENAAEISSGLQRCTLISEDEQSVSSYHATNTHEPSVSTQEQTSHSSDGDRPWAWHHRHSAGGAWIEALSD